MAAPPDDPPPGVPEWVVTYGDMMSLLLTFFIMLVSLNATKEGDGSLRTMMDAINAAFGPTSSVAGVPGSSLQTSGALSNLNSRGVRSEGGTKKASRTSAGNGGAFQTVERINHGTVITLGGPMRFAPFDATLTDEIKDNLSTVYRVIADVPQRVMIRGHSSPKPIPPDAPFVADYQQFVGQGVHDRKFDHFDLSFARAEAVARHLIELGIDPQRLIVSAAGDAEPRLSAPHAEDGGVNRRVDVFLIDSYITRPNAAGTGAR